MKTLYIIGNGFDISHDLDTKYQHFALYLKANHNELYELILKYYWLPDLDPNDQESLRNLKWGEFESKLAEMDFEELLEDFKDYLPDYGSDEFRSRDYHSFDQQVGAMIDRLTTELYVTFKEFILHVAFHEKPKCLLALETNAQFLSFNYTDTLERYYGINKKHIKYIHGRAKTDGDTTILGHGIDPIEFMDKTPVPPVGLSDADMEMWREEQADNWDYAYDSGRQTAIGYFNTSHKSTSEIIAANAAFFDALTDIERVIVLGHSISPVDQPYFSKIIGSITYSQPKWLVSYFSDVDIPERLNTLKSLGVSEAQIEFIKIDDLKPD